MSPTVRPPRSFHRTGWQASGQHGGGNGYSSGIEWKWSIIDDSSAKFLEVPSPCWISNGDYSLHNTSHYNMISPHSRVVFFGWIRSRPGSSSCFLACLVSLVNMQVMLGDSSNLYVASVQGQHGKQTVHLHSRCQACMLLLVALLQAGSFNTMIMLDWPNAIDLQ